MIFLFPLVFGVNLFHILVSGSSLSDKVHQTPADMYKEKDKGETAEIICSHSIDNYDRIFWYKQSDDGQLKYLGYMYGKTATPETGAGVKLNGGANKGENCTLTTEALELKDSAVYFCAVPLGTPSGVDAYFGGGTKLTVLEHDVKEPKVEILGPSPKECRNEKDHEKKKTLLCVVSEFYPDHISVFWQVNENNVTSGVATDEIAQRDGKFYTMSSRLRVSAEDWFNPENEFKCIVIFFDGENYQRYESTINGEQSTVELNYRDKYLKATQKVKLSYTVFIIKSSIYGAFVAFLVWKLQRSTGK